MTASAKPRRLRIIGGRWKSRRLQVATAPDLRPSPDAVRETLFNWLSPRLARQSCLDLFAGSGAFGFEAASRGAARVVMVESNRQAVAMLRANRDALYDEIDHAEAAAAPLVEIFSARAECFLQRPGKLGRPGGGFDVVFLDPPFASALLEATCAQLQNRGFLNADAVVYIESPSAERPLPIPSSWHIIREKKCGMVRSTLLKTMPA